MKDFRTFYGNKSDFLKASDLGDSDVVVTIRSIGSGRIGDDVKPVFYFHEFEKGLFTNKINGDTIGQLHGYDPEGVIGQQIILFATQCQNSQGQIVPCIRVRPHRPREDRAGGNTPPAYRGASVAPRPARVQQRQGVQGARIQAPRDQASELREQVARDADDEFRGELYRAFRAAHFTDAEALKCLDFICQHKAIESVYELDSAGRVDLLAKIASGRYDRFKTCTQVA